ncbi:MAG: hypothetical protein JRH11_06675 [Deltaproteobacteria bacterium]|nr:hypothetical protein [Deltaproteobacteria bacterium]
MKHLPWVLGAVLLLTPALLVVSWESAAEARLEAIEAAATGEPTVAIAAHANEAYCTPQLKQILRRVLSSCGLIGSEGGRGCQPLEARNVATMDDADFNQLFVPMQERGGIVQYDRAGIDLDDADYTLIDQVFANRGGASYFLVVARASPDGSAEFNSELSQGRAEAVLAHLAETFPTPELEREVGLLWLGEEYAQLDPSFCAWSRSGEGETCEPEDLNRSAFITWIDCTL